MMQTRSPCRSISSLSWMRETSSPPLFERRLFSPTRTFCGTARCSTGRTAARTCEPAVLKRSQWLMTSQESREAGEPHIVNHAEWRADVCGCRDVAERLSLVAPAAARWSCSCTLFARTTRSDPESLTACFPSSSPSRPSDLMYALPRGNANKLLVKTRRGLFLSLFASDAIRAHRPLTLMLIFNPVGPVPFPPPLAGVPQTIDNPGQRESSSDKRSSARSPEVLK